MWGRGGPGAPFRGPGSLPAPPERCSVPAGWLPALQLVRRGSKAVTRHWKAMHFQRQKLMAVTEYIAPRPAVPERCLAPRRKVEEEEEEVTLGRPRSCGGAEGFTLQAPRRPRAGPRRGAGPAVAPRSGVVVVPLPLPSPLPPYRSTVTPDCSGSRWRRHSGTTG